MNIHQAIIHVIKIWKEDSKSDKLGYTKVFTITVGNVQKKLRVTVVDSVID